jgi:AMP phosphorylase
MQLKAKVLGIDAGGKNIVILNKSDAEDLGIKSLARVKLIFGKESVTAIVNITTKIVERGFVGIYNEIKDVLNVKDYDLVEVKVAPYPNSLQFIKKKLKGSKLNYFELKEIVRDVVEGNLTEIEISSFVTALHNFGMDLDESANLTLAMVETGKTLELDRKVVVDKHSIGGVPGDKTTLLLVPIIAAANLTIPKTSSRAITSPSGTADKAECLMPVDLNIDEMKEVIEKTNGCIVWGGNLYLAPADDAFIQVEYPLGIDPLLLPSIMSKKKAVGAKYLAVDIPCGRGTKVKTIGDANLLARDFIELGRKLLINVQCAVTYGEQPLGYGIGPALEAREALEILMRKRNVIDVIEKATSLAGVLLEMAGMKNGRNVAKEILKSKKAEDKLRKIIAAQGGNENILPQDIEIGDYGFDVHTKTGGRVLWIDNSSLVNIARAAGAPKDKGAGILLRKKIGDKIKKGEKIFTVYAEKQRKLERVAKVLESEEPFGVGSRIKILIHTVKEKPLHKKTFILER